MESARSPLSLRLPSKIAKTCYHSSSRVTFFPLFFFFFFLVFSRIRERTHAHIDANGSGSVCTAPLIRLRPIRAPSKKVIIFIRTGKCLTKRVACYCSDGSRSDCCFVSLTRNVCRVSGFRFSDHPTALCNHKRLLMQRGKHEGH